MNSESGFPMPAKPASEPTSICYPIRLVVRHPLPSWNAVCALGHWQRAKLKEGIQLAFLSALQATAADCSTKTTSAKNTLSIAADILVCYRETTRAKRASLRLKKKLAAKTKSGPKS
jgi:hypothetical protein